MSDKDTKSDLYGDRQDKKETVKRSVRCNPFKSKNASALLPNYNKVEKISPFADIAVKVQEHVYHLDKVILAMKSAFFEKLFTLDFDDRKQAEVEIRSIEEEIFSTIVEYIYNADLVINERNYVRVFLAMDYFQMEIDTELFTDFLVEKDEQLEGSELFKLYHYVCMRSEYKSLTNQIHQHFSDNLDRICGLEEFLSLTPAMLIKVLSSPSRNYFFPNHRILEIGCEWICHDFENRLPCIVDLVNAVKSQYGTGFSISSENYKPFEEPDEQKRKQRVRKYFHRLLNYNTELRFEPVANNNERKSEANKSSVTNLVEKLNNTLVICEQTDDARRGKTILEQGQFCDISVQAGDETFQLHRIKLFMEIPYFRNLLSQSPNITHHTLDAAIDGASFKEIVQYVYYGEINLADESQIRRLFGSCELLEIETISMKIYEHVIENWQTMKDNIVDILPSILRNGEWEHCKDLEKLLEVGWEEICEGSRLTKMSFDALEYIVSLPWLRLENEHSLLNICCKWVHHDVKNRYQFIPELALAINRNSMADYEEYNSLVPEDLFSEQQIKNQLQNILENTKLVSTSTEPLANYLSEELVPCFVISKEHEVSVLNAAFDEIICIPFSKNQPEEEDDECLHITATLMQGNLFMLFFVNDAYSFQVYNLRSKKITSLTFDLEDEPCPYNFRLLNCNNELYFCGNTEDEDNILKYSYRLNRWIKFPLKKDNTETNTFSFLSDGKTFYRLPDDLDLRVLDEIEVYNFENKSWRNLPVPIEYVETNDHFFQEVTMVNGNLCFLFGVDESYFYAVEYQQETQSWHLIAQTNREMGKPTFISIKSIKDSIVFITGSRDVHTFSITDRKWQMKKEIQIKYTGIVSIDSVS